MHFRLLAVQRQSPKDAVYWLKAMLPFAVMMLWTLRSSYPNFLRSIKLEVIIILLHDSLSKTSLQPRQ